MTAGNPLAFPSGRALAGWWRQLAPHRPVALWVGQLLLHHVEALTRLSQPRRPDSLATLLLRAVSLEQPAPPSANNHSAEDAIGRLDGRLHLGRQALRQALRALASEGLVEGGPRGPWGLSPLGRHTLETGEYRHAAFERLPFHFVDSSSTAGGDAPPTFLDLRSHTTVPWPAQEGWSFDVAQLQACVARPAGWKELCGFPREVEAVVTPEAPAEAAPGVPAWQRVVVDRPERLPTVIVRTDNGDGPRLLGFAVKQDTWGLSSAEPAFALRGECAESLAAGLGTPPAEAWREAWRQWCVPRSLPVAEVEACGFEPEGARLRVLAPPRLVERLRVARSDALKGEAWLLCGEQPVRAAACVVMTEAAPA